MTAHHGKGKFQDLLKFFRIDRPQLYGNHRIRQQDYKRFANLAHFLPFLDIGRGNRLATVSRCEVHSYPFSKTASRYSRSYLLIACVGISKLVKYQYLSIEKSLRKAQIVYSSRSFTLIRKTKRTVPY